MTADQGPVETLTANAARHFAGSRLKSLRGLRARQLNRRPQAEDHPGSEGDCHAEGEHGKIDVDGGFMGERVGRQIEDDDVERLVREQDAEPRAGDREQQGFRKQLANDAAASGANGGANGELVLARGGAGEQKDGHIAASDEQQKGNRAKQQVERSPELPNVGFVQPFDMHLEAADGEVGWRFLCELLNQGLQGRVCLRVTDAGFETNANIERALQVLGDLLGHIHVDVKPR